MSKRAFVCVVGQTSFCPHHQLARSRFKIYLDVNSSNLISMMVCNLQLHSDGWNTDPSADPPHRTTSCLGQQSGPGANNGSSALCLAQRSEQLLNIPLHTSCVTPQYPHPSFSLYISSKYDKRETSSCHVAHRILQTRFPCAMDSKGS